MKFKSLCTISFILIGVLFAKAGEVLTQDTIIRSNDLRETWRIFDEDSKSFVKAGKGKKSKSIHFNLRSEDDKRSWLSIHSQNRMYLLINGKYAGLIEGEISIDLDSVSKVLQSNTYDFVIFSNSGVNPVEVSTVLYTSIIENRAGLPIDRSQDSYFRNFFVLAVVTILLLIGFLFNRFPRDSIDYFSFQRSISFKNREETLVSTRPFNRTNILFIILASVIIGFLLVAFVRLSEGGVYLVFITRNMSLEQYVLGWLGVSSIVFVSFIMKYILINIFTGIFKLGEFRYIQHFNALRFSLGSFLVIFIFATLVYLATREEGLDIYFFLIRILVVLLLLRMLILFFKLRDYTSFKNFHLFSYLCGTEVIPFIIIYKLVLG